LIKIRLLYCQYIGISLESENSINNRILTLQKDLLMLTAISAQVRVSYSSASNHLGNTSNTDFNNPVVQKELLEAVMTGTVTDEVILNGLRNCTPCISPEDQNQILNDKLDFFVGTIHGHPEAMVACKFFIDPSAQRTIAYAIQEGRFGAEAGVLTALAGQLAAFTDPFALRVIAAAIRAGRFGAEAGVLTALAGQLAVFTELIAQRNIAAAIRDGRFGAEAGVLTALIAKLAVFTDSSAQRTIAVAIREGRFGAMTGQLAVLIEPAAQGTIASAIGGGLFGADAGMLTALAGQLATFTDPAAQGTIASAIGGGLFGAATELATQWLAVVPVPLIFRVNAQEEKLLAIQKVITESENAVTQEIGKQIGVLHQSILLKNIDHAEIEKQLNTILENVEATQDDNSMSEGDYLCAMDYLAILHNMPKTA
jgi:hypothetical protein